MCMCVCVYACVNVLSVYCLQWEEHEDVKNVSPLNLYYDVHLFQTGSYDTHSTDDHPIWCVANMVCLFQLHMLQLLKNKCKT